MPNQQLDSRPRSPWNSLEVAKLAVGVLTPMSIALVSLSFTRDSNERTQAEAKAARDLAQQSAAYSRVVDKRVALWDKMAVPLNDIYAYMLQVGHWKTLNERDIIARKRQVDAILYANRPFFSQDFVDAYDAYMKNVFEIYGGVGQDARLRTSVELQLGGDKSRFTGEDNRDGIHNAYYGLLDVVAEELNLKIERPGVPKRSGGGRSTF